MNIPSLSLKERFSGLILDRNTGRVVGTKLASVTGHLLMSIFFAYHNYKYGFNINNNGGNLFVDDVHVETW